MTIQDFKERVLPLKNPLFRFAFSYLRDESEAEDTVQEVMIECWERIADVNEIRNMEAYCVTLTKNRCLDRLKKKGRFKEQLDDRMGLVADVADPHRQTQVNETMEKVKDIIAELPEKQREVLHLRDLEGYSYKEIAEMLQLEMNHIKVLLHRGRKAVQSEWQKMNAYGIQGAG